MCKECGCGCNCNEDRQAGLPRLNEPAPEFEALTTHGTLRLSDYQGSWLVLFSHPADFTPVCTTEFVAFTELFPELQKRGVELLGLSIDGVFAHIAWIRDIEAKFKIKIPFPVIADLDMKVAKAYGMIMPQQSSTEATRCVFVIDPKGILRAMIYYPMAAGRNTQEILRLIDALQVSDKHGVATPANWQPGDKVILPAPKTQEGAEKRIDEGFDYIDWYLCKKEV
jgi:peroxiredoxin (alkyl hydroperoxide reductase subunit C)